VPQAPVIKALVKDFVNRSPMRTTSLVISMFGDVVTQHGHTIWLGSLVNALALLGVNDRLVRTTVFRLVKEGWLEADRVGRRSYYRFSDYGLHEYQRAARRIYAMDDDNWRGHWQLLIPVSVPERQRDQLRRSLQWQGYRTIAPGTFAKPGDGGATLRDTLEEFGLTDKVMILDASTSPLVRPELLKQMVETSWQLEGVASDYRDFLKRYKPLLRWVRGKGNPDPQDAFAARVLLIHDYRRILLHDTPLPDELLPARWPGAEALALASEVYRALAGPSVNYVMTQLERGDGPLPAADAAFSARFQRVAP
jgi:phenylacetic acid degradation operon negative regulatory protein